MTDKLREAAQAVLTAWRKSVLMTTADYHGDDCDCLRCQMGWLEAALAAAPQPAPDREVSEIERLRYLQGRDQASRQHHIKKRREVEAENRQLKSTIEAQSTELAWHRENYASQASPADREALVEVIRKTGWICLGGPGAFADALLARGLRLPGGEDETMAWAAKVILSQPKRPDSPVADAFTVACAYLEDRECGAETTNEIIETFLKTLAGEDN